eukprot:Clim_evm18s150 gene=Clim_evmTU18s150
MKNFRKNIAKAEDLKEETRDLQLPRVSREVQDVLQTEAAERQRIYTTDVMDSQIREVEKELKAKKAYLATKTAENEKLRNQIWTLQRSVRERVKAQTIRLGGDARTAADVLRTEFDLLATHASPDISTKDSPTASKCDIHFRKVARRRELHETARAQTEEINILARELQRRRRKAYSEFPPPQASG